MYLYDLIEEIKFNLYVLTEYFIKIIMRLLVLYYILYFNFLFVVPSDLSVFIGVLPVLNNLSLYSYCILDTIIVVASAFFLVVVPAIVIILQTFVLGVASRYNLKGLLYKLRYKKKKHNEAKPIFGPHRKEVIAINMGYFTRVDEIQNNTKSIFNAVLYNSYYGDKYNYILNVLGNTRLAPLALYYTYLNFKVLNTSSYIISIKNNKGLNSRVNMLYINDSTVYYSKQKPKTSIIRSYYYFMRTAKIQKIINRFIAGAKYRLSETHVNIGFDECVDVLSY
jgi:hypothetical protein